MEIRQLTKEDFFQIYETRLRQDFPEAELKPKSFLEPAFAAGLYRVMGFYEEDRLVAYACLCDEENRRFSLLDYYAVDASIRGKGYGGQAMKLLRKVHSAYAGLIIESENPAYAANEEELSVRTRRIAFYEKCGLRQTRVAGQANGVDFCILYASCGGEVSDEEICHALADIYRYMIPKDEYDRYVHVKMKNDSEE